MATEHSILLSINTEDGYTVPVIKGCSCGWLIPSDTKDPDDAIVMHIATRGVIDSPALPTPGLYRHYKGGLYTVVGLATIEATMEPAVVYVSAVSSAMWVRTLDDFCSTVEVDGVKKPRFTKLGG